MENASAYGKVPESLLDKLFKKLRSKRILKLIPKNSYLIDLGCGFYGQFLFSLENKIKKGLGLDLEVHEPTASDKIRLLKTKVDEVIPVPDESVQTVTALALIEHVDHPEKMLSEVHRILEKGGTLVLTTPSAKAKCVLEFLAFRLNLINSESIRDHKRYYTIQSLTKSLADAGFALPGIQVRHFQFGYNILAKAQK